MKNNRKDLLKFIVVIILLASLFACSNAYKKLIPYTFRDKSVAAVVSGTPWGNVQTNSYFTITPTPTSGKSDTDKLLNTIVNIGTTVINSIEANKAQTKLDSAMKKVNVAEIIKTQTLQQSSNLLHFNPTEDTKSADFLFSIVINNYGISANSWASSVNFQMDVTLKIYDNATSALIWKTGVNESRPVSSSFFLMGSTAAGNVLTALQLSQLTPDQMATGFQNMAEYTANELANKLQKDYAKSREAMKK
ncbi:MAG TPA: hypothetical protein ENG70_04010 [Candidatus Cloacimonetes bacterium]|nr:hypothetical protein [Candidatus Cloacimonadota bacterium]HEX38007.1 hypothetical protein [Candidatus Cloacimonadota bacterium]